MPKLNFYDTDAVKAFTLDVLVDNAELRRDLDFAPPERGRLGARERAENARREGGSRDRRRRVDPDQPVGSPPGRRRSRLA